MNYKWEDIIYKPKDVSLIKELVSSSSRGVLSKAWYNVDGMLCLVKGNSIGPKGTLGLEPYSEVMVSRIAEVLGIDNVPYTLSDAKLFPHVNVESIQHVSVCENFLSESSIGSSLENYLINELGRAPKDNEYLEFINIVSNSEQFYKILALDALVGNEDRHTYNIDIITDVNGKVSIGPVFDNGASLLSYYDDKDLGGAGIIGRFDKSKPFRTSHRKQVKLLPDGLFTRRGLTDLYDEIIGSIEQVLVLLSTERSKAIRRYLKSRMKYMEGVMR